MAGIQLTIDVENSAGVRQGEGPITSATGWRQVRNLDRLGSFEFEMPADDPRAALLTQRAVVRAKQGATEVGAGIVDKVEVEVGDPTMLRVSGNDLGQELTWRTVGQLSLTKSGSSRAIWMQMVWIDSSGSATSAPVDASAACDGDAGTYYTYSTPGANPSRPWLYVGAAVPFTRIDWTIDNPTAWANQAGTWQYFNGTAWVSLNLTADTTRSAGGETLQQNGYTTWAAKADWVQTTESGYTCYFMRVEAGWATSRRIHEVTCSPVPVPTDGALALIAAKFPTGWTLDAVNGLSSTVKADVYGELDGENCVEALVKLAELTGEHWRVGTGRTIVWLGTTTPSSGITAVGTPESTAVETNADVALVKSLRKTTDSYARVTRVYPYGAGLGSGRLTLAYTTRTAAAGYTLDKTNGYIAHTANDAAARVDAVRAFKDIGPRTSDKTAREAAANQLYDAALIWLANNLADAVSYDVELVKAGAILPGTTVRVLYTDARGGVVGLRVDATLIVLSATATVGADGMTTTALTVASVAQWPVSDTELLARLVQQSVALGRYPQPVEVGQVQSTSIKGSGRPATIGGGGLNLYIQGAGG